ncbi:carboxypeptidase-like regulatory domain-containing protein [Rhodohalobacter mucosus]|uniref:Carboxypeptidase-like regulatory domain-containing protein n=1 Tax=Rhodohalobacter mucosus TaxID=2079485 RepID=A0A316TUR0_9BACT|nr:carboxypeptidase-like regulatory domain-containing protein [Rhodohalobacter mucosus]PWN08253.1 hypothetical protein DDZ15_01060 [Rhodohalobacter mucosus]
MIYVVKDIRYILTVLFVFIVLIAISERGTAQDAEEGVTHITGLVVDEATGEPLQGVNVYLSFTTQGDATDEDGRYSFRTPLTGNFELVFSMIGFEMQKRSISIREDSGTLQFNAEMTEDPVELGEVEVRADNSEWLRNFAQFKEEFLGTTSNASDAEIENRWMIDFDRNDDGELVASAEEPVRILNHALGYELTADLDDFSWNLFEGTGQYRVTVRFEEMETESGRQARRWRRARENAFEGSLRHFLLSLYEGELSQNQFELVRMNTQRETRIYSVGRNRLISTLRSHGLDQSLAVQGVKGFVLREPVDVLIGREEYLNDTRERARLVPLRQDQVFFVMPDGTLADLSSVGIELYWATRRMADMVPFDYKP